MKCIDSFHQCLAKDSYLNIEKYSSERSNYISIGQIYDIDTDILM